MKGRPMHHKRLPARRRRMIAVLVLGLLLFCAQSMAQQQEGVARSDSLSYVSPGKEAYLKLAEKAEAMLRGDVLGVCFPRAVDAKNGGYFEWLTRDGHVV